MDPVLNPYAPGAGTPPPELAGRGELRAAVRIALKRTRHGRPTKSVLMIGLRGVGKTVLLNRMREDAEESGLHTLSVESLEDRSLPAILLPHLRQTLLRLSHNARARDMAQRGLRALAGFVSAFRMTYQDIEVGVDFDPEPGLADNGDLEQDLAELLLAAGAAAREADTALCLFVDELQYVDAEALVALITALHRAAQRQSPIVLVGAGLPQLRARTGQARTYAERLFDFPEVGPLAPEAARQAIEVPALAQDVSVTDEALQLMIGTTRGYPYFLQEWGKHAWNAADASPIELADAKQATVTATAALDESFFRVRFDRLTPSERKYLRAMAELGQGPHRSGDIANVLGRDVDALAPRRSQLIAKGMVWSPSYGDTDFTVPLFDEFMRRIMPNDDWRR